MALEATGVTHMFNAFLASLRAWLALQWRSVNKKTAAVVGLGMVFYLFGDFLLPHIGHMLHLLLEVVELSSEHLLQEAFDLSHHTAEMITAYTGLGIASYAAYRLLKKAYALTLRAIEAARARFEIFREAVMTHGLAHYWRQLAIAAGIATAAFYLMF
jgi:hypothetical protein